MIVSLILLPMLSAFLCYFAGKELRVRNIITVCVTLSETVLACLLLLQPDASLRINAVTGLGLTLCVDGFRRIYCIIIAFVWFMTTLMGTEYFRHYQHCARYCFFNLMTLGATMGVFLSADLFSALVFFEIMSFTSYTWVIHDETPEAIRAANTYLAVAVIGGMTALMGLFLLHAKFGTTEIAVLSELAESCTDRKYLYIAGSCVLFGFGAKAGMFPLHIWLPKAHPVAPAPASALLSGILTKSGIFGVIAISCNLFRYDSAWGNVIVILGTVTMFLGAVLALFSVNLKRTLACSSVSQIGFILIGIGMTVLLGEESALAARGSFLHMLNHSLFKLVLFLCAAEVYINIHKLDLNEIRGFGRNKPFLLAMFLIGSLGIGCIPFLSGYVSKTMLHEGIVEYIHLCAAAGARAGLFRAIEWTFLLSGGMTVAYMTKLFVAVFVEKNSDPDIQARYDAMNTYIRLPGKLSLFIPAGCILLLGIVPNQITDRIADLAVPFFRSPVPDHTVSYFSFENIKGSMISIGIGVLLYFLLIRPWMMQRNPSGKTSYVSRWPQRLDLEDLLYRPLILSWLPAILGRIASWFGNNILTAPAAEGIKRAGEITAHAFSDMLDALILLLRKTVYRPSPQPEDVPQDVAERIGQRADAIAARHGAAPEKAGMHAILFPRVKKTLRETRLTLTGNLSFALIMFLLAAVLIFLYILFCGA